MRHEVIRLFFLNQRLFAGFVCSLNERVSTYEYGKNKSS